MKKKFGAVIILFTFLFGAILANDGYCKQKDHCFLKTYTYKLKKGDNLYRVGLKFNLPWKEIAKSNNISNERALKSGRELLIEKEFPYNFIALTSWYGSKFHGRKTANGEVYDMCGLSAAHKTLPLGTVVLVSNPQNGRQVELRINDRGPYIEGRSLDLSFGAAKRLDIVKQGVASLLVKVIESK